MRCPCMTKAGAEQRVAGLTVKNAKSSWEHVGRLRIIFSHCFLAFYILHPWQRGFGERKSHKSFDCYVIYIKFKWLESKTV